jgi:NADH-quinone oxidoreductase subunit A
MTGQGSWPLAVYFVAILALLAAVMVVSHLAGERHHERATAEPFECGIAPLGYARLRVPAKFYLVAMLFVIFDVETVFIISWAVVARDAGWPAYVEIAIFVAVLLAGLAYLWRQGALDWGPKGHRKPYPLSHWTRAAERPAPTLSAPGRR